MDDVVNMNVNSDSQVATINQVISLIDTLYNSRNSDEQNEANRRLVEFQSTPEAWQVSWILLDSNQKFATETRFFAAQMLLHKINHEWSQQDPSWLENQLRPKLFEILVNYASQPEAERLVMDRLSLVLANYAIHAIPTFWPDAIQNILQTFTSQSLPVAISSQRIGDILIKILRFLPEEYSVHVSKSDIQARLNTLMIKSGPVVFKFLQSQLVSCTDDSISIESRQNLLKCLSSWTLHSGTSLFELEDGVTLLDQIYNLIEDEELCAAACSAVAASFSNRKTENYQNSIIDFIPKIAKLRPLIEKYKMEENVECVIMTYSLVINFSQDHSRLFLRIVLDDGVDLGVEKGSITKQAIFTIIETILECTSAPGTFGVDEKYSDMSFTFWLEFFENFYYYSNPFVDKICETFDPLVDSLLQTLMKKSQYPQSKIYYQCWNDDQREAHRCYRQDLSDSITLIASFPKARDRIIAMFYNQLAQEITNFLNVELVDGERPWQCFESIVFALKSISENIPFDEITYTPRVLNILAQIPYNEAHTLLYCTVAELISAYSDWLYSNHSHLPEAYNILFPGVSSSNSQVRLMSTLSIKDITSECQPVLRPYSQNIVKSCIQMVQSHSSNLTTNEKSRLMHAIGVSLAVSDPEHVIPHLENLTTPLIYEVANKSQCNPNLDSTCRDIIFDRLSMLNSLIESLHAKPNAVTEYEPGDENSSRFAQEAGLDVTEKFDMTEPVLSILQKLLPILNTVASKYQSDKEIIEIISDTAKRSAKSLGTRILPVLKDLMMLIVTVYDPLVDSNILEGSLPLYTIFRSDTSLVNLFKESFSHISEKVLNVCLSNPLNTISFAIENYFKHATLVCKRFTCILTDHNPSVNIEFIYKLAIASLELPEKRTLVEVCNFLCLFRTESIGVEHLDRIFVSNLEIILGNIFNIFGGIYSTPRNAIENVSDLLYLILDNNPHVKEPLKRIVEKDNFPTTFVDRDHKERFISKIVHEKNRRKFRDACNEFVRAARNLTRY